MGAIYQQKSLEKTESLRPKARRTETDLGRINRINVSKKQVNRPAKVYTELKKMGVRGSDVINN